MQAIRGITAEKVACHCGTHLHMRTVSATSVVVFGLFNTRDKQVGAFRGPCDLSLGFRPTCLYAFALLAPVLLFFALVILLFIKRKRPRDI